MREREFNLLEEPWILLMKQDGAIEKVSLADALVRAHEFRSLAGELATQDAAVMRLLLASLYAVLLRCDAAGNEMSVDDDEEALARWKATWDAGRFPAAAISRYFSAYRDRFWLFDPERPFFQVPENPNMEKATRCSADNLNHEISESGSANTSRFFLQRSGEERTTLRYDEAARWLVCLMSYDTAVKPVGSKCWLGTFNVITADGDNLFETLMLNLVMGPSARFDEAFFSPHPTWESARVHTEQRREIPVPSDLAALYTTQQRRVILTRENGLVVGFREICGDVFSAENAFIEPMAAWKARKDQPGSYYPIPAYQERQLWRSLSALLAQESPSNQAPGVVKWLEHLIYKRMFPKNRVRLKTVFSEYDGMGYCIKNVVSDGVSFHAQLLSGKSGAWIVAILNEVDVSDALARQAGYLAKQIAQSAADTKGDDQSADAREQAYFALDIPFLSWLEQIDPDVDEIEDKQEAWWADAQRIVRRLGRRFVEQASPQALVGRTAMDKHEKKVTHSVPAAYNYFLYCTSSRQALETGGKKNA